MKILNIFKKENKNVTKSNVQKMDKKQLSKVIGGQDDSASTGTKLPPSIGGVVIDKGLK